MKTRVHDYTHLVRLFLILLLCLFCSAICYYLLDTVSQKLLFQSEQFPKMPLDHNNGLYICGERFALAQAQYVQACWSHQLLSLWYDLLFGPTADDFCRSFVAITNAANWTQGCYSQTPVIDLARSADQTGQRLKQLQVTQVNQLTTQKQHNMALVFILRLAEQTQLCLLTRHEKDQKVLPMA